MSNSSIWPIDRTLLVATKPGHIRPGCDGNEEVLHILQISSITGASLWHFAQSAGAVEYTDCTSAEG